MTSAYPTRIPYENIYSRYAQHMPDFVRALEPPLFCEALSLALEIPPSGYQLGRTKIFFKAGKGQILEELAERDISEVVPMLIEKIKQEARRLLKSSSRRIAECGSTDEVQKDQGVGAKDSARTAVEARLVEYKKRHIAWRSARGRPNARREAEDGGARKKRSVGGRKRATQA